MQNTCEYSVSARAISLFLLAVFAAGAAFAQGNIDKIAKYAWSENAGWQNWRPTYGGVTVVSDGDNGYLSGYAWGENIGWVKLGVGAGPYINTDAINYGVNMDAEGKLSGYAWSENCGWINFCTTNSLDSPVTTNQVTITAGSFDGYAWAENVGFIHFRNAPPAAYNVGIMPNGTIISVY